MCAIFAYMNEFREKLQDQAVEVGLLHERCTLVLPMRTGKSLIGLRIASEFERVLVVYPNKSILKSWKDDIEKFGVNESNLTFTTHISLKKHNLGEYDLVILDEIDQVSLNNWYFISENTPKRIVGLTGTPPVSGNKFYFMNRFAPVRYEVKLSETVGLLNKDYKIRVHLLEPSKEKNIPLSGGRTWSEYDRLKFFDRKYTESRDFKSLLRVIQLIQNSPTKINYLKALIPKMDRGLVFVETTKQCDELKLPAYHSKEPKSEENLILFQDEEIDKLVTVSQLKAGVTFKNLKRSIILHCYASNNRSAQKIGRCLNFCEGQIAEIDIIALRNTREESWIQKALADFDQAKIEYI